MHVYDHPTFHMACQQFDLVADRLDIPANDRDRLKYPKRALTVAVPVRRDDGSLALDRDENVWVYNRPNDLTNIELHAELTPPLALCCMRAPAMIHLDRAGKVMGSFDAPQGHGMDVDSAGFDALERHCRHALDHGCTLGFYF